MVTEFNLRMGDLRDGMCTKKVLRVTGEGKGRATMEINISAAVEFTHLNHIIGILNMGIRKD